VVHLNCIIT